MSTLRPEHEDVIRPDNETEPVAGVGPGWKLSEAYVGGVVTSRRGHEWIGRRSGLCHGGGKQPLQSSWQGLLLGVCEGGMAGVVGVAIGKGFGLNEGGVSPPVMHV